MSEGAHVLKSTSGSARSAHARAGVMEWAMKRSIERPHIGQFVWFSRFFCVVLEWLVFAVGEVSPYGQPFSRGILSNDDDPEGA